MNLLYHPSQLPINLDPCATPWKDILGTPVSAPMPYCVCTYASGMAKKTNPKKSTQKKPKKEQ